MDNLDTHGNFKKSAHHNGKQPAHFFHLKLSRPPKPLGSTIHMFSERNRTKQCLITMISLFFLVGCQDKLHFLLYNNKPAFDSM